MNQSLILFCKKSLDVLRNFKIQAFQQLQQFQQFKHSPLKSISLSKTILNLLTTLASQSKLSSVNLHPNYQTYSQFLIQSLICCKFVIFQNLKTILQLKNQLQLMKEEIGEVDDTYYQIAHRKKLFQTMQKERFLDQQQEEQRRTQMDEVQNYLAMHKERYKKSYSTNSFEKYKEWNSDLKQLIERTQYLTRELNSLDKRITSSLENESQQSEQIDDFLSKVNALVEKVKKYLKKSRSTKAIQVNFLLEQETIQSKPTKSHHNKYEKKIKKQQHDIFLRSSVEKKRRKKRHTDQSNSRNTKKSIAATTKAHQQDEKKGQSNGDEFQMSVEGTKNEISKHKSKTQYFESRSSWKKQSKFSIRKKQFIEEKLDQNQEKYKEEEQSSNKESFIIRSKHSQPSHKSVSLLKLFTHNKPQSSLTFQREVLPTSSSKIWMKMVRSENDGEKWLQRSKAFKKHTNKNSSSILPGYKWNENKLQNNPFEQFLAEHVS